MGERTSEQQAIDVRAAELLTALTQANEQPTKTGGPIVNTLFPGDSVSFTCGKELFSPVKFNVFEVGPITVATVVRPGESAADAYVRAATSAKTMFMTEFHLKRVEYFERMEQVKPK